MADVESSHDLANSPLNVLAVDADKDSLLSLEKVLEDCNHKVTKCNEAEQCLTILRDSKTKFHLVIIDVNLPTIGGYELCALIRKENDLPIILTSFTYTNVETVQKALSHGACDFLLKPVTVENLRKIDLHTLQNRTSEKDVGIKKEWSYKEEEQEESVPTNDEQDVNTRLSIEKRKGDSITRLDPRSGKKERVIWVEELHQKFVEAVDFFGLEKAVPKKILEMMNIPELTRENVASHLQKFRQSHKRMQKDSQPKPEKQQRRQQQQKHEQHQCKPNETMRRNNEPKPHDFKIEPPVLEDPTTQQPDLMQVPLYYSHHTIHDTTYEALTGLRMDPSYNETTMMGLKMNPTIGYVYSSNDFRQHSFLRIHEQSMSQLSNETSGYLYDPSEMGQYHTNFASNPALMPKIEPSYDPSHNQIQDNYNFGNSVHNANIMKEPTFIQISHPQTMLSSVGYDVAAMHVDDLHQGGSVASQTDQEDNAETQDMHLKEFSMKGYQHFNH